MTLHAKMEALRAARADYVGGAGENTLNAVLTLAASARKLLEEYDRPASERAKEWRKDMRSIIYECPMPQPYCDGLLDAAERAITHAGAAGDQGEVERLRDVVRNREEQIRNLERDLQERYDGDAVRLDEAHRTIDKLVAALAQKGAG